ncbi:type II toxin-antitoxin system Phd/YefM family antitoxin [Blautia sp.]|uniref:type II toxin-antitoxin system Phd/YefM family antitoxin n=1 Tax=Blautia sp. TaxID=1955243 RepID=UPI00263771FE|nr:type II toxin-antitoxin system Phd/YefM family antitoxin [Blautia sp.]MEE0812059.1 type II toxin-antitoxin system Phd/YefM family antitoxin [Blautia sp.]
MANIMDCLVPISLFNKGQATKIFSRLRETKELFVLKNNQPSAVILAPEEYARLTEIEENYTLLLEATRRLEQNGDKPGISMETVMAELGIHPEELEEMEDVDIE